ncbi:hypothetical protein BD413DRAFT_575067 [Trametes elegans]|nr:hypothetical protein BD413DRAFT_575067 [Trametes elegans]
MIRLVLTSVTEAKLIQDPYILTAIVFGNARIEIGILVDPVSRADSSGDELDGEKIKDFAQADG